MNNTPVEYLFLAFLFVIVAYAVPTAENRMFNRPTLKGIRHVLMELVNNAAFILFMLSVLLFIFHTVVSLVDGHNPLQHLS